MSKRRSLSKGEIRFWEAWYCKYREVDFRDTQSSYYSREMKENLVYEIYANFSKHSPNVAVQTSTLRHLYPVLRL